MNTVQVTYTLYIVHVRTCKVYSMSLTYCGALQASIICMYCVTEIKALLLTPRYIYTSCMLLNGGLPTSIQHCHISASDTAVIVSF